MPVDDTKIVRLDKYNTAKVRKGYGVSFYWNEKFTSFLSIEDLNKISQAFNELKIAKNESRISQG